MPVKLAGDVAELRLTTTDVAVVRADRGSLLPSPRKTGPRPVRRHASLEPFRSGLNRGPTWGRLGPLVVLVAAVLLGGSTGAVTAAHGDPWVPTVVRALNQVRAHVTGR
jgi:hypothetical protein